MCCSLPSPSFTSVTQTSPRGPALPGLRYPGMQAGMGSGRAARQRFLSALCGEAFCKVTARNPPIMGIKITQAVSRARRRHPEEPLCSSGTNTPGHLLCCEAGGGRCRSPAIRECFILKMDPISRTGRVQTPLGAVLVPP